MRAAALEDGASFYYISPAIVIIDVFLKNAGITVTNLVT
jgi:hypothetical protein